MREFKFFQKKKPIFQTEITNHIERTPQSNMSWSRDYSEAIREWLSDLFFTDSYQNVNRHLEYIALIDRTCELMETPRVYYSRNNPAMFNAKVKIWRTNEDWMIIDLAYPIDHIIYR